MHLLDAVPASTAFFLLLAVGLALSFEFVNGFHDTANAVATVIYTHSLRANFAVVWSGCWNLIGVLSSSGAVAFSITALLPIDLVLNVGSAAGFAMVFALLISAIIWNLGTWYLGLPASSSHTLIGAILGVGLAHSMMSDGKQLGGGVNWAKAGEVATSMFVSPLVGFGCAALLLMLARLIIKNPDLYRPPQGNQPPPLWIRGILVLTCTGVSFAHGSNDGQKGMGLILLILVGILPASYAINLAATPDEVAAIVQMSNQADTIFEQHTSNSLPAPEVASSNLSQFLKPRGVASAGLYDSMRVINGRLRKTINGYSNFRDLPEKERSDLRSDIYLISESINKLQKSGSLINPALLQYKTGIDHITKFIPFWVKLAVAFALGLGTMIGWKRIVVTVGEKIGKEHLTYGQGAAAELVAMITIGAADIYGLPVSTTHVLSSGVAGTMAANHSGLQMDTLRNLALAWVMTLPVCIFMGAALFALVLNMVLALGLH